MSPSRHISMLALLVAAGIALHLLESLIPLPLPFLRIGLANVSTVIALMLFGMREALTVAVVRVLVGSLLGGTLFGPGFMMALGAGLPLRS